MNFLECSQVLVHTAGHVVMMLELLNTFRDMNYYPVIDRRTESDAYEPTVQYAQVGSKIYRIKKNS